MVWATDCEFEFAGLPWFSSRSRFRHSANLFPCIAQCRHWPSNFFFVSLFCWGWDWEFCGAVADGCGALIWLNACALEFAGRSCAYRHLRCTNVRISSIEASCFPAIASSFCIFTGSLANRKVSAISPDLSPNACFATFWIYWEIRWRSLQSAHSAFGQICIWPLLSNPLLRILI